MGVLIREPVVSGTFYPRSPQEILKQVETYVKMALKDLPELTGRIIGVISPHAGYIYSGPIAGYSYAILSKLEIDTVVVLAPSHRHLFYGASVMPEGYYRTPLGDVKIDEEYAKNVINICGVCSYVPQADMYEHSLEVQIPFLQYIYNNDFKLLPIVIGDIYYEDAVKLAESLYSGIPEGRKIVIVASTDLSHFYPYDIAIEIDKRTIQNILQKDPERFYNSLRKGSEACGGYPITVLMAFSKLLGDFDVQILKYANSGDTAGDKSSVVGYLSAVFYIKE